jgi:hypothetical protein
LAALCSFFALAWRVIKADQLPGFDFSDLLATLVSFFAIFISMMFYFDNSRRSDVFQGHMLDFSMQATKMLQDMIGMQSVFEKQSDRYHDEMRGLLNGIQDESRKRDAAAEKAKQDYAKAEQNQEVTQEERDRLKTDLERKEKEAEKAKEILFTLKNVSNTTRTVSTATVDQELTEDFPVDAEATKDMQEAVNLLAKLLSRPTGPIASVETVLEEIANSPEKMAQMRSWGMVNHEGRLTDNGSKALTKAVLKTWSDGPDEPESTLGD